MAKSQEPSCTPPARTFVFEVRWASRERHTAGLDALGAERTVLNYVGPTLEPPYFTSAGGESDEPIAFLFGGTLSEYAGRNAIDKAQGLAAAREYCVLGERPRGVQWEAL